MEKIDGSIRLVERLLICGAFIVMVLVTFAQVVARFIFRDPISWTEELARFLFVWITLIGSAHAIAFGKHFRVDFLIGRFSPALQKRIEYAIVAFVFAFASIMIAYGCSVSWRTRFQISPALELPMSYPYLCIPVAGLFIVIHLVSGLFAGAKAASGAGGGHAE
ncbi:MAG: TRAP transporter small permease [Planctomycetota bacterium]|jgi:TRAP-type C4-dicarboxylate transport system permease small subunit|nr:TRAP transporter small permease [Planctomycetota bacterium]